ncbi:hypothetical protein [Glycomyces sp. NRRL B-16210]|uniref:hypothetical protein n=1 Tax=Glycomyces sp. NRRL B-16210 TaxID=1463821 RepID=UPI0004C24B8D|nr:hypothetical protein [Glycomyces sp. NRRL B-16210]
MPNYHVFMRAPNVHTTAWTVDVHITADSPTLAKQAVYDGWKRTAPFPIPDINSCDWLVMPDPAAGGVLRSNPGTTSAQKAFADELQSKIGQFLGAKLDGTFSAVSYPAGFNYGITYGPNAYYNQATLNDLDSLLATNGPQLSIGGGSFSSLYRQILGSTVFGFSKADLQTMNQQDNAASAQITSIVTEFVNAGGVFSNPLPFGGKLQDVFNQLLTRFGSLEDLPTSLSSLYSAIASYKEVAEQSILLHRNYYEATARLNAARANILKPDADNGGEEIGAGQYFVGYTPGKLPSANQLIGSLQSDGNAVSMQLQLSNFSSKSTDLSVSGKAGFSIPVMDAVSFNFGGSASYDMSTYTSSSSEVEIGLEYKGVTIVGASPTALSPDGKTGWYDEQMLTEIAAKSGKDATGFQLQGGEFNVDQLFGQGKALARLKTFVISRQPQMSMTFKGANASRVTSDMKVGATASVDLFGLFRVGSASANYSVSKVDASSSDGSVTVTFGPPEPSGTIPLEQQVAYVMGGVAQYPPAE